MRVVVTLAFTKLYFLEEKRDQSKTGVQKLSGYKLQMRLTKVLKMIVVSKTWYILYEVRGKFEWNAVKYKKCKNIYVERFNS